MADYLICAAILILACIAIDGITSRLSNIVTAVNELREELNHQIAAPLDKLNGNVSDILGILEEAKGELSRKVESYEDSIGDLASTQKESFEELKQANNYLDIIIAGLSQKRPG